MSAFAVYRIGGGLLAKGGTEHPYTEAQAAARCEKANADAERLGIEARYEIAEANHKGERVK